MDSLRQLRALSAHASVGHPPRFAPPAAPGGPRDDAGEAGRRGALGELRERKLRVLIIDDERAFRVSMRLVLETVFRSEVADVGSGPEGVARVGAGDPFDVVFLDLMMAGMGGNETYLELLKLAPSLPVIFMSAYPDSAEWKEAKVTGVTLLHKPIPLEELARVLSRLGGGRL